MAVFKKNIWSLFYLILLLGSISLATLLYALYSNTHDEYKHEQENIVKITANSINSIFLQYEMILNILGNQLIKDYNYKSLDNSKKILDNLIKLNPSILGFSLTKPNGQAYLTSSNIKINELPNLSVKKETKETFQYTLHSSKMIIGRTYFQKQLNNFIVPIRKSIRDENNNIIAVMTMGIDLESGFDFFMKNNDTDLVHETFLFRDFDHYFQIAPKVHSSNTEIYDYKIPKDVVEFEIMAISKRYNMTLEEIKDKQIITTTESFNEKRYVMASSIYLKRHELWLTSQLPLERIHNKIYKKSAILIFVFLIVNILIYYLFRYINNYEKKKQKILYYQATHDYLTNLHNRLYLSKEYKVLNKNNKFSLLFIDMDNFKHINDSYGHTYGDKILIEISNRLRSLKKDEEVIVRYSGDEFIFITPTIDKDKIKDFASLILNKLSQPYIINQYQFLLGASIGVSQFPFDGKDFEEIKRYADIAMYEAKKTKNTYYIFDNLIKENFFKISIIEEELKLSLLKNEIYMMYQPQIKADGTLFGVEALVRWENKKIGFVPPDKFISIAEDIGFMNKLGEFIIKRSLSQIRELQEHNNINFNLSINISVKQFMEVDFYENVLDYTEMYNFDNVSLTLEVTENVFIEDIDFILILLLKLKKHGIKISLDDFGTGYSSLSLLKKLPIDELKIDKSFVDDIAFDNNSKAMVENIIAIAKNLNISILAEGIESFEQKEILTSFGCDLFQGYYFSKPLKIEQLKEYIAKE